MIHILQSTEQEIWLFNVHILAWQKFSSGSKWMQQKDCYMYKLLQYCKYQISVFEFSKFADQTVTEMV